MQLYTKTTSGNAYKVDLFLSILGLDFERVPVDLTAGEHKTAQFLEMNPRGQIPVLVDGDIILWESQSILVYLARKYADPAWLPIEPEHMAETIRWLSFSGVEVDELAMARRIPLFGWDIDQTPYQERGKAGLAIMEDQLSRNDFLAGNHPTVADMACYPYVGLADEGGVDISAYPHVVAWCQRIEGLSGYVTLPGR